MKETDCCRQNKYECFDASHALHLQIIHSKKNGGNLERRRGVKSSLGRIAVREQPIRFKEVVNLSKKSPLYLTPIKKTTYWRPCYCLGPCAGKWTPSWSSRSTTIPPKKQDLRQETKLHRVHQDRKSSTPSSSHSCGSSSESDGSSDKLAAHVGRRIPAKFRAIAKTSQPTTLSWICVPRGVASKRDTLLLQTFWEANFFKQLADGLPPCSSCHSKVCPVSPGISFVPQMSLMYAVHLYRPACFTLRGQNLLTGQRRKFQLDGS